VDIASMQQASEFIRQNNIMMLTIQWQATISWLQILCRSAQCMHTK